MSTEYLHLEAERIVHRAEVRTVALAIRSGRAPAVGQILEYQIEEDRSNPATVLFHRSPSPLNRRLNTYQFAVKQSHLDEAARFDEGGEAPRFRFDTRQRR